VDSCVFIPNGFSMGCHPSPTFFLFCVFKILWNKEALRFYRFKAPQVVCFQNCVYMQNPSYPSTREPLLLHEYRMTSIFFFFNILGL
jgi:hypothetical protein